MLIRIIEITNLCVADMKKSGWGRVPTVASSGVVQTVNMLLPGRIRTERLKQLDAEQSLIPAGRYGTVEDFGHVGAFLCSEAASYMAGGLIRCDRGSIRGI